MKDESPFVRTEVARNPSLTKQHLDHLMKDEVSDVRRSVTRHPSASKEHLDHLRKDMKGVEFMCQKQL